MKCIDPLTVERVHPVPLVECRYPRVPPCELSSENLPSRQQRQGFRKVRRTSKVRFAMEYVHVHEVDRLKGTWLDDESILRTLALLKRRAEYVAQNLPEVSTALECLRSSCQHDSDSGDTGKSLKVLTTVDIRGLEQRLLPTIKEHRKRTVRHLLLMQRKLREDGIVNRDTMDYLLHQKSLQLSQESRHLALHLARVDNIASPAG